MSHSYLNLWLPKPIFQHNVLLNLWPYATEMWQPVRLRGTTLHVSVATISFLRKWLPRRPQTSFRGLHSPKEWKDGSRKEPDLGCKVDEAGQSIEVFDGHSGMQTCAWPRIVMVKKHFFHIFIGTNPPKTLLQLLQSFHIDVRVDRLASGQHIYENDPFTVPKDCRHGLAGWGNFFKLVLPRRVCLMPLHGLPFRLGLEVVNPCLIARNNGRQYIVTLNLVTSKQLRADDFLCSLCSSVRLGGTHWVHTLEYPNWRMILSTFPLPIPNIAASSLVVILRSFLIRLPARCIVAGVTGVDGRPERGRSDTLPCPCSDDTSHFAQQLTVLLSTAMSP
jgi:hypothetical protein